MVNQWYLHLQGNLTTILYVFFYWLTPHFLSHGAVTLSCYTEYMKAVIGKQYLISKGCLDCNLYISDATCTPDISKDKITFYIPYDGCGTKREVSIW